MQKYSPSSDKFKVNRHSVRDIFVDEILLKINSKLLQNVLHKWPNHQYKFLLYSCCW